MNIHEFEEFDDFVQDDILAVKKSKVDGKKKGNRVELELTKILSARFKSAFSRTVASGARWSQATLTEQAKQLFSGDLIVPKNFKFVIECKGGYDSIDLNSIFIRGNSEIDKFLDQVTKDSERCGRLPIVCWKQNRKPWLAFLHSTVVEDFDFRYKLIYRKSGVDWTVVALDYLLQLDDDFFYECKD